MILATFLVPLALAALLLWPRGRRSALAAAPLAAFPALVVATFGAPDVEVPWLLLDSRFGLDPVGQVFLVFTAGLWLVASVYAAGSRRSDPRRSEFAGFFLLAMAGNLLLVVAHDAVTFYTGFALMTLAAYPLVLHERTADARRAANLYLALAMVGDVMILAGLLGTAHAWGGLALPALAAAAPPSWAGFLLVLGFGVKAGILPLHVWLPLAHPAAPVPASAVLSGAMIAAGVLGWMRFLPIGGAALPDVGVALAVVGIVGAYYAAIAGAGQADAKTVLAYSSVSQIGLLAAAVGVAAALGSAGAGAGTAIAIFALHHGFAKGALFLGVGIVHDMSPTGRNRLLAGAGLTFAAAALVGAPLTSGVVAKHLLEGVVEHGSGTLAWLVKASAAATTLLMARFLHVIQADAREDGPGAYPASWLGWSAALLAVAGGTFVVAAGEGRSLYGVTDLSVATVWGAVWPILVGVGAYVLLARAWLPRIPPGDVLVPATNAVQALTRAIEQPSGDLRARAARFVGALQAWVRSLAQREHLDRLETWFRRGATFGVLWLAVTGLMFGILLMGAPHG